MNLEIYEIEDDIQEGLKFCHKLLQMYMSLSQGYEDTIKKQGFDTHIINAKLTSIEKQYLNIVEKTDAKLAFIADRISAGTHLSYKADIDLLKTFFSEEMEFMSTTIPVKSNLFGVRQRQANGGLR